MSLVRLSPLLAGLLVVLAIAGMAVVGSFLPVDHVVTRRIDLGAPPDEVWRLVDGLERYPEWVPGLTEMEPLTGGDGERWWRQRGRGGELTIEVVERVPPRRLVTRPAGEDLPFAGSWTYDVAETPEGSTLVVTERGSVDGRIARFLSRYVFGQHHAVDAYLSAVARRLGSSAVPAEGQRPREQEPRAR